MLVEEGGEAGAEDGRVTAVSFFSTKEGGGRTKSSCKGVGYASPRLQMRATES
jgi:hypothetical protein